MKTKGAYICGDFNIDLLKYENNKYTRDFVDTLFSYCLFPLTDKPTRITSTSITFIDNTFIQK